MYQPENVHMFDQSLGHILSLILVEVPLDQLFLTTVSKRWGLGDRESGSEVSM